MTQIGNSRESLNMENLCPGGSGCLLCIGVFRNSSIQYKLKWNGNKYQNMNYLPYHSVVTAVRRNREGPEQEGCRNFRRSGENRAIYVILF